jgi:N-acetylglucosamine-6-phosphate deacetylase
MGQKDRGMLQIGRRADFVVLSDEGEILQTWVRGKKAFDRTAVDSADDT